jgi:hypothetical protein
MRLYIVCIELPRRLYALRDAPRQPRQRNAHEHWLARDAVWL